MGATRRQGPRHPGPDNTQSRKQRGRNREGEKKKKKTQQEPQTGQPQPGGGRTNKERTKTGHRKAQAHQSAPGRPACPTRPRRARTRTHARDPGVALSVPKVAVSSSTRNSPGTPAKSPVERRAVRETGRVSEGSTHTKPPQRTQPKTDARGTRQGQPHCGAQNRYDAELPQRRCLGSGQRQAQRARFSAGLHVPRAAAQ